MTSFNPEPGGAQSRITSRFGYRQQAHAQRTGSSDYYEQLGERLDRESVINVPRSRRSWSAEENRLGSWSTGVGRYRQSGTGPAFVSGVGLPRIQQDRR